MGAEINAAKENVIKIFDTLTKKYKDYNFRFGSIFYRDKIDSKNDRDLEENENKLQHVMLDIKKKYGKNSILKAMNLSEGATTIDRNKQIGGHRE